MTGSCWFVQHLRFAYSVIKRHTYAYLAANNLRYVVVWSMLFVLLVECWCLIKGSTLLAQCAVSIFVSNGSSSQKKRNFDIFFHVYPNAVEQTVEMQVRRKLMKLILCYCYVIWHSVIDYISGPVCGETTGHQWIPVACVLVVQCATISSPVVSPHKMSVWCFLTFLPERAA